MDPPPPVRRSPGIGLYDDLIEPLPAPGTDPRAPLRGRLERQGQFGPEQVAGRLFPIACVALEVTQRCNLDCTLCYLSDLAEATPDPSLDTLLGRVARIRSHYGQGTNIQITGGDPTLRAVEDLEILIRRIRSLGMRSALFTNGIRARRPMLVRLAAAGLDDVCFHVDLTQERRGYPTEASLNVVRESYLDRTNGLGLRVNFNTTVHDGNLAELPGLVRWFTANAARINLASFQMQAETGRGVLGSRDENRVTQEAVAAAIRTATGNAADFGVFQIGHPSCNRHASILAAGGRTARLYADRALFRDLFAIMAGRLADWNRDGDVLRACLSACLTRPRLVWGMLRTAWRSVHPLVPALLRGHRPHRLSFFIHNFMSADAIDRDRCKACVFTVMTARGPISMCAHNADRDHFLMDGLTPAARAQRETALAFKQLKGRLRARARTGKAGSFQR